MAGLENPALLGLALAALPALYYAYTADETEKKVVGAAKTASILLLAVGAASPYYLVASQQLSEEATVTVLKDSSRSTKLMEDYSLDLEGVEVVTKTIATGNSSNLRQGILRNLRPDTPYLLVSDGQSTKPLQGLAQKFRRKNSTLHLLKPDMAREAAVSIKGPSSTVIGAENRFTVKISSTNGTEVPEPVVTVDGEKIDVKKLEDKRYSFTEKFSTEQDHTIKASINIQDRFEANNQYFKTVEVTEKPEILVLGNRGGLKNDLEEFYDLTYRNSIPEDLSSYYAVIAKKQFKEEQLAGYITKGNGLIYTG
ncbi:MAG: hypothetical protein ABEJ98_05285, partial [Candidatus Nanohaloarchaea archaeon]